MNLEPISYAVSGKTFVGYLADGSGGGRVPGVLVAHEGGGLTEHCKRCALALAEVGYVAFACDLFGEKDEAPFPRYRAIVQELRADRSELRRRMLASLDVVAAHPHADTGRLAAVGYCFGGAAVIELARAGAALKAVCGMHAGVLPDNGEQSSIRSSILMCHGADDPVVPLDQIVQFVNGLSEQDVDWQLHAYGGVGHSFTNPEIDAFGLPGFAYSERADHRSWRAMLDLFDERLA